MAHLSSIRNQNSTENSAKATHPETARNGAKGERRLPGSMKGLQDVLRTTPPSRLTSHLSVRSIAILLPTAPPSGRGLIQLVVKTWIHSATMQKTEALLEDKTEFNLLIPKTSKNHYSHVDHLLVFFGRSGRPATTVGSRMTQTVSATLDAMSPVELGLDAGRSRTQRPRSGSKFWEQLKCKVNTLV